jgi:hypothetical protein
MFTAEKRATLTPGVPMAGSGCVAIVVIHDSPGWGILHAEDVTKPRVAQRTLGM